MDRWRRLISHVHSHTRCKIPPSWKPRRRFAPGQRSSSPRAAILHRLLRPFYPPRRRSVELAGKSPSPRSLLPAALQSSVAAPPLDLSRRAAAPAAGPSHRASAVPRPLPPFLTEGLSASPPHCKMKWVSRKIHLYNVTMGLYMLDWWERYLFNILIAVLLWFICYNAWRSVTDFFNSHVEPKFLVAETFTVGRNMAT